MRSDSKVVPALQERGPLTYDELGLDSGIDPQTRMDNGIAKFGFRARGSGAGVKNLGSSRLVYYLPEHSAEEIVRKWIEVNEDVLRAEKPDRKTLSYFFEPRFQEVWSEIADEFDWVSPHVSGGGSDNYDGMVECPYCGDEVKKLPTHIPKCSEAV